MNKDVRTIGRNLDCHPARKGVYGSDGVVVQTVMTSVG